MLILHRSLHILVSHGSHDGSQVSGSLQNPGAVIMSPTIQDKIFGKPSLDSGFAKSLRHCGEMSRLGALRMRRAFRIKVHNRGNRLEVKEGPDRSWIFLCTNPKA